MSKHWSNNIKFWSNTIIRWSNLIEEGGRESTKGLAVVRGTCEGTCGGRARGRAVIMDEGVSSCLRGRCPDLSVNPPHPDSSDISPGRGAGGARVLLRAGGLGDGAGVRVCRFDQYLTSI